MKILKTKFVQFESEDGLLLPGLLFEPGKKSRKVAINLHGNGSASVFYSFEDNHFFSRELNKQGMAFFTFNNRGAHYVKRLTRRVGGEEEKVKLGTTFEMIKDCLLDIGGAIAFLKKMGYEEFYLLGHSTGANKICVYHYFRPKNPVKKYVLLGGGDDTGILHDQMGGTARFRKYLQRAKREIDKGNGRKLIPKYMLDYLISYQSLYDTCNPDGSYNTFPFNEVLNNLRLSKKPLFREFKSINKPTLVIYGENDEYCYGEVRKVVEILKKEVSNRKLFNFQIVKDADHGFSGCEQKLARLVAEWLSD